MKATAAFVTLLTSGGRKGGGGGGRYRIRGQSELAVTADAGGCCTGAAGDQKRGEAAT